MRATAVLRRVARAAAYAWTSPNSLLGLVVGLLSFQRPRVERGVVVFDGAGRGSAWVIGKLRRAAITLGHVVVSRVPLRGRLLLHELHHVRQYERLGPLYLPAYLAIFVVTGYRRHPFELAATRAERPPVGATRAP